MPRTVTIPLFGLLAFSTAVRAECFCLLHPQTGNMLYGCEARNERYLCSDVRRPGVAKTEPPIEGDWKRVECPPDYCPPPQRDNGRRLERPRGGDEEPKREEPRHQEPKPDR